MTFHMQCRTADLDLSSKEVEEVSGNIGSWLLLLVDCVNIIHRCQIGHI